MSEEAENEQLTIRIKDGVSALLAGGAAAAAAGHTLCAAGERPRGPPGRAWLCCLIVMVCDRPYLCAYPPR